MRTYEYKEITLPGGQSPVDALNAEGVDGWTLVSLRTAPGVDIYLLNRNKKEKH